jgi:hypothetical protein
MLAITQSLVLKLKNASLISEIKDLNCNDSISCLRNENAMLKSKIDELNVCKPYTSTIDHVSNCTRCRDINVEAINDHLAMIKQQNNHIAKLTPKINEHEIENEKFKFARSMSSLMPLKDCLILLRARHPWFRIMRAIFCIMLIILSTKFGKFMLGNLILFLTMLLYIRMRHLALGKLLMLNCLERKFLLHQMNITFYLRLLMHLMCLLTNQAK